MEHLICERYPTLPICIVRPSIVAPTRDASYGYGTRAGFALFVQVARYPIMMAPCSQGRLNLVFVEDVAKDIVKGAQELAAPCAAGATKNTHPILSSTSHNEMTPSEWFHQMNPHVKRVRIDNPQLRQLVRSVEFLVLLVLFGKKTAKRVEALYKNYDMIMSEEFDFEENHEPVASQVLESIHSNYNRQGKELEAEGAEQASSPAKTFHSLSLLLVVLLAGLVAATLSPNGWGSSVYITFVLLAMASILVLRASKLPEDPRFLRHFSHVFDYAWLFVCFQLYNAACRGANFGSVMWRIPFISLGTQTVTVIRDGMYMKMFPKLIAKEKVQSQPGMEELKATVETWVSATALIVLIHWCGCFDTEPVATLDTLKTVWLEFFAMMLLTDCPFMRVAHGWMHRSPAAFRLHKKHHIAKKSCQAYDAFRFSFPDLMLENGLAPVLFLAIKAYLGLPVHMNMASVILLAHQQILEHSCNPHTGVLLNPLLDSVMKTNIAHSLHHAIPKHVRDNGALIPLRHFSAKHRHAEMRTYEEVFDIDLGYGNLLSGKQSS